MYIYRAINAFDEQIDPIKNGLISKSIIGPILSNEFMLLAHATCIGKEYNPILSLDKGEKEKIYRELRKKFEINGHIQEFLKIADENQQEINEIFKEKTENKIYIEKLLHILSTKNSHITNGSTKDCPWISFTTSLEKTKHYYEDQEKNCVVVVDSNINKFYDIAENDILLALDLSSDEKIRSNEFIINLNKRTTKLNYRGLNYAKKDNEVIYYNRVPKEKIITVLKPLQYELLLNGLLDESYYEIPDYKKNHWDDMILSSIRELLKDKMRIMQYVFEEYYSKNNSLKTLAEEGKYNLTELKNANEFILSEIKKSDEVKRRIRLR